MFRGLPRSSQYQLATSIKDNIGHRESTLRAVRASRARVVVLGGVRAAFRAVKTSRTRHGVLGRRWVDGFGVGKTMEVVIVEVVGVVVLRFCGREGLKVGLQHSPQTRR